jgi:hypothetical protein
MCQIEKSLVQKMRVLAFSSKEKSSNIVITRDDIEPFLQAQQSVADYLQAKHYRPFLLSDFYRSYVFAVCPKRRLIRN